MKRIHILSIVALLALAGCTRGFEEFNTNPNDPASVEPSLLLRQVIYDFNPEAVGIQSGCGR